MKSEQEIRERLVELDGEYIPNERGGKFPVGKAVALKWALDDPNVEVDSSGQTLSVTGVSDE